MARCLLHVLGFWSTLGGATLLWIAFWERAPEGVWVTAGRLLSLWIQGIFGGAS